MRISSLWPKQHWLQSPMRQVIPKTFIKKTQTCIFTSGTDVKKLWIKNLKVTFHQKLCFSSLSSDLGLCSQTAPTHWFSQDMPWSAQSERSSPRSTKKDEGFFLQNGTSRSVHISLTVFSVSPTGRGQCRKKWHIVSGWLLPIPVGLHIVYPVCQRA